MIGKDELYKKIFRDELLKYFPMLETHPTFLEQSVEVGCFLANIYTNSEKGKNSKDVFAIIENEMTDILANRIRAKGLEFNPEQARLAYTQHYERKNSAIWKTQGKYNTELNEAIRPLLNPKRKAKANEKIYTIDEIKAKFADITQLKSQEQIDFQQSKQLFSKLLTTLFSDFEKKLFETNPLLYVANVDPVDFRSNVNKGYGWKDPAFPGDHGEFNHRLQWYLIHSARIIADDESFVKLYQFMGRQEIVYQVKRDITLGLWDAIFDRAGNDSPFQPISAEDFRSPETLGKFIQNDETFAKNYPFLATFLRMRYQKRLSSGHASSNSYLINKLSRIPAFNQLEPADKVKKIVELVNQKIITAEELTKLLE